MTVLKRAVSWPQNLMWYLRALKEKNISQIVVRCIFLPLSVHNFFFSLSKCNSPFSIFLRVRMFMCVHLPGYFFFSLVCRPSVCWAAILHCEYTLERSIFFCHLFMLEAFYKLTNFCMEFLSHFLFVITSHLEMILNEMNENAITLWQMFFVGSL